MRLVADTNVVVSALLWGGPPQAILTAARDRRIGIYTSAALFAELEEVLGRAKMERRFAAIGRTPAHLLDRYLALTRFVIAAPLAEAVSRDPDDDQVIACALAARANLHRLWRPRSTRPGPCPWHSDRRCQRRRRTDQPLDATRPDLTSILDLALGRKRQAHGRAS